jgi:hypothetical protein
MIFRISDVEKWHGLPVSLRRYGKQFRIVTSDSFGGQVSTVPLAWHLPPKMFGQLYRDDSGARRAVGIVLPRFGFSDFTLGVSIDQFGMPPCVLTKCIGQSILFTSGSLGTSR